MTTDFETRLAALNGVSGEEEEMKTANVLMFKEPDEPKYIKAIKKQLALLTEVQIELDRETSRLLYFLKQYEESK